MSFYKKSKHYRYKHGSCTNCNSDCSFERNRDHNREWLDNGRCGCLDYSGDFEDEMSSYRVVRSTTLKKNQEKAERAIFDKTNGINSTICSDCNKEIEGGFYNTPSGAFCCECWDNKPVATKRLILAHVIRNLFATGKTFFINPL